MHRGKLALDRGVSRQVVCAVWPRGQLRTQPQPRGQLRRGEHPLLSVPFSGEMGARPLAESAGAEGGAGGGGAARRDLWVCGAGASGYGGR